MALLAAWVTLQREENCYCWFFVDDFELLWTFHVANSAGGGIAANVGGMERKIHSLIIPDVIGRRHHPLEQCCQ